ncbi:MAG TPA: NAD(P)/FAD-dependent oxidoreductase [Candidatus Dormibacteraeota bacterium]
MSPIRAVVMGAGPAGLTAAYELDKHSIPVTVVEEDPVYVGGIARTASHNGYRFDIGGHRFFSKNDEVEDLWTEILGDEMLTRGRLSRIYYRGKFFDYPLKATNALFNMGLIETIRCGFSYLWARIHPVRDPKTLEEWVSNQFGHRLFIHFFKTYTEKVWGIPTSELSADWAAQRIKGLDLGQVIKSALLPQRKPKDRANVIKTLIDRFRYPRYGPGQLWERVRDILHDHGHDVRMGEEVVRVTYSGGRVRSLTVRGPDGREETIEGDQFISSLPMRELVRSLSPEPPPAVRQAAESLRYRDFLTVALMIDRDDTFPDNWIYIHDPDVKVGRLQNFKNWSEWMVPDRSKTCIGMEYFCFEGDGLWTSSDEELIELGKRELSQLDFCRPEEVFDGAVVRVQKAYPVYDDAYTEHVKTIRDWAETALPNLHFCGRNGMHKYNNQDHSMMSALLVARRIAGVSELDPWNVNADAEYHEELRESEDATGRLVPQRVPTAAE